MFIDFSTSKDTWNALFKKLLDAFAAFLARFNIKLFADEETTTEAAE